MKWAAGISVAAGLWLAIAPFATGYQLLSSIATTEAVVVGLFIAPCALWIAVRAAPIYADYALMLLGAWSVAAPFVLASQSVEAALYTDTAVGLVVLAAAAIKLVSGRPLRTKVV
jgi:ABC-type transport system involved in cytochrome c biogenesis permease subunit